MMMELTISRNTIQKVRGCGTEIGFSGRGALGQRLDLILEVFSNLNDSVLDGLQVCSGKTGEKSDVALTEGRIAH